MPLCLTDNGSAITNYQLEMKQEALGIYSLVKTITADSGGGLIASLQHTLTVVDDSLIEGS